MELASHRIISVTSSVQPEEILPLLTSEDASRFSKYSCRCSLPRRCPGDGGGSEADSGLDCATLHQRTFGSDVRRYPCGGASATSPACSRSPTKNSFRFAPYLATMLQLVGMHRTTEVLDAIAKSGFTQTSTTCWSSARPFCESPSEAKALTPRRRTTTAHPMTHSRRTDKE